MFKDSIMPPFDDKAWALLRIWTWFTDMEWPSLAYDLKSNGDDSFYRTIVMYDETLRSQWERLLDLIDISGMERDTCVEYGAFMLAALNLVLVTSPNASCDNKQWLIDEMGDINAVARTIAGKIPKSSMSDHELKIGVPLVEHSPVHTMNIKRRRVNKESEVE
ncbi:hypothetical protein BU24DRAFT_256001 [Aaosphaeria arxii CBS 175.79]|uniref:Uncharacterized protein n=1 Tax=Aaosphaeria arxii CBS 175.79 TaxID=1450172 RepID=A0A6A5XIM0_9PLEO|nr:uncharacterized protein BU24DRAFT_256001 [Aaosphaeria arxii CBS 175.79]KAF2012630.1 hypothetical protein BU24DRAFT_256001 [Aaosphaeria arxii CBS 175.79]